MTLARSWFLPALALGLLPVSLLGQGHEGKDVAGLIRRLDETDPERRSAAMRELTALGVEAVPALVAALGSESDNVRCSARDSLVAIGAPAIPWLIPKLDDRTWRRIWAAACMDLIGRRLKREGSVLWWVVPWAYWKEALGLLFAGTVWSVIFVRYPACRPSRLVKQLQQIVLVALVPVSLASGFVYYATSQKWAQGFLPDTPLTLLPFKPAAILTAAFACFLPAIWICQRKPLAPKQEYPIGSP